MRDILSQRLVLGVIQRLTDLEVWTDLLADFEIQVLGFKAFNYNLKAFFMGE